MAAQVVTDSGIFIAAVLTESYSVQARALIGYWKNNAIEIITPTLFRYELSAVIRKNVFRQVISAEVAAQAITDLQILTHGLVFMLDENLLQRSYELAVKFLRANTYDSQYLAVAERLNCEFWTTDERLFNAIKNDFPLIRWLGNFSPTT